MSGSTAQLESFDKFFSNNYNKLLIHAKCLEKEEGRATDLLHSVYIKIKQRIIASGYTTYRYLTYVCHALTNTFYSDHKSKKID